MDTLQIILIGAVGIWIGYKLAVRNKISGAADEIGKRGEIVNENKQKVLELFNTKTGIANNDVEKLLGVSDATAERYLNELEKDGVIKQVGATGRNVYYEKV